MAQDNTSVLNRLMHLTGHRMIRYQVLQYSAAFRLKISVDSEDFSACTQTVKQCKISEHFLSQCKGNTINRNFCYTLPNHTASHPRRHRTSAAPPFEPKIPQQRKTWLWTNLRQSCDIFLEGLKKPTEKFWSVCWVCHYRFERGNFRTAVTKYTASSDFLINPQRHSMNQNLRLAQGFTLTFNQVRTYPHSSRQHPALTCSL